MPLSWNEIKTRAVAFTNKWKDEVNEHAEAKSFWDDFLLCLANPVAGLLHLNNR